jgi:hypothetical protein
VKTTNEMYEAAMQAYDRGSPHSIAMEEALDAALALVPEQSVDITIRPLGLGGIFADTLMIRNLEYGAVVPVNKPGFTFEVERTR